MSKQAPGLQYPAHLNESSPNDAALKSVFDNLFYLRNVLQSIPKPSNTLTTEQIQQLVSQTVENNIINITSAPVIVTSHGIRLTTTPTAGALLFEYDRVSFYVGSNGGNPAAPVQWEWAAGCMVSTLANIPSDLTSTDKGFLFVSSDAGQETQYTWDGSQFVTTGGYLQQIKDSATATSTTVQVRSHSSSGTAAVGFGLTIVDQLQDSAGSPQTAVFETTTWSATTVTAAKNWWIRVASVLTNILQLGTSGLTLLVGNFIWKAGTSSTGTLTHANSGNRSYTFPDATGNIPYEASAPTATHVLVAGAGGGGSQIVDSGIPDTSLALGIGFTAGNLIVGAGGQVITDSGIALSAITGTTLTLAKVTVSGTDGSITFNNSGLITGYVAPT